MLGSGGNEGIALGDRRADRRTDECANKGANRKQDSEIGDRSLAVILELPCHAHTGYTRYDYILFRQNTLRRFSFNQNHVFGDFFKRVVVANYKELPETLDVGDRVCQAFPAGTIHIGSRFVEKGNVNVC